MTLSRTLSLALSLALVAACHHAAVPAGGSAPKMAAPAKVKMPDGVTALMISQGDSMFHAPTAFCQRCHGPNGAGGTNGPSLVAGPWLQSGGSYPEIASTIITGVPAAKIKDPAHRFAMNPHGGPMNLSDEQARTIAAYIWSISRGKAKA